MKIAIAQKKIASHFFYFVFLSAFLKLSKLTFLSAYSYAYFVGV